MPLPFVVFIVLLVAVLAVWARKPYSLVIFVVFLLVFTIFMGNPLGLLASEGGWMILILMLAVARLLAIALEAVRDARRRKAAVH